MSNSEFPHLRQLRTDLGMTQEAFARSIGMSKTTYNNYETGAREPRSDFWEKVAKKYNVTVDFLLGLSNEKFRTFAKASAEDLSPDERKLLKDYRKLSKDGQDEARNHMDYLISQPKYIKCDYSQNMDEA